MLVSNSFFVQLWLFTPSTTSSSIWNKSQLCHANHLHGGDVLASELWFLRFISKYFLMRTGPLGAGRVSASRPCSQQSIKVCGLFSYISCVFSNIFSSYSDNELFGSEKFFLTWGKERSRDAVKQVVWMWERGDVKIVLFSDCVWIHFFVSCVDLTWELTKKMLTYWKDVDWICLIVELMTSLLQIFVFI